MTDYAALRRTMVESQLRASEVTDRRVLAAMGEVPRELFVAEARRTLAYMDAPIGIVTAAGRRELAPPALIGKLVQLAQIDADDSVLEIGATTGYGAAVMGRLARSVVALENDYALVKLARAALASTKSTNVAVVEGPLERGHAEAGPYDVIVIAGAIPEVPAAILAQLRRRGRLVALVGDGGLCRAEVFERAGKTWSAAPAFQAAAAPLPGFQRLPVFQL